tara:strand:- start:621 stop:1100 length:480 start_codon:yes stop_codon:yes gene_type:complete
MMSKLEKHEAIEEISEPEQQGITPPSLTQMTEPIPVDNIENIQDEIILGEQDFPDDLDLEYDDELDNELNDDDYLDNYDNEMNYSDVLAQFLEDDIGKNVAENLNDLVKVMSEIKELLKISIQKNCNSIDQNSKCILKLQKTFESFIIKQSEQNNTISK